jgi:hypothetical protein
VRPALEVDDSVLAGERSYLSDCFLASEAGTVWSFSAPTVLILEVNFRRGVEVEVRKLAS